jgi:hypothetical protein
MIQWVISGWKSRLEGSKKGRTSGMVGCYTDAINPQVRGGFYSLAKPANGGNIWREKEWEHMAGKDGANKWCKKMAGKMHGKICTSYN